MHLPLPHSCLLARPQQHSSQDEWWQFQAPSAPGRLLARIMTVIGRYTTPPRRASLAARVRACAWPPGQAVCPSAYLLRVVSSCGNSASRRPSLSTLATLPRSSLQAAQNPPSLVTSAAFVLPHSHTTIVIAIVRSSCLSMAFCRRARLHAMRLLPEITVGVAIKFILLQSK